MIKKTLIAALAAATVFCLAVPAMAEEATTNTFTTADGILSIELPDASWAQLEDPSKWVALSDGSNLITIEHYSNGEDLPGIAVADSHYINTLTAAYTTQNEVFIASGFVVDPDVMNSINEAMLSIKILKYDTKVAVAKQSTDQYTIVPRDTTMYVKVSSDTLSVRSGYSVDSDLIGSLANGTAVHVTGVVQKNGTDNGWVQISYNNGTGFVSSSYLTSTAPAAPQSQQSQQSQPETGSSAQTTPTADPNTDYQTYLVYSQGSGRPVNITGNNGVFYDGSGEIYYAIGGGNFTDNYGAYYSTTMPASAPDTDVVGLVSDGSGRPVTIMQNDDGSYTDEDGNNFYQQADGSYIDDYDATYQVSGTN